MKFLIKIWPALLPILVYVLWVLVIERIIARTFFKKKPEATNSIDGEYKVVGEGESSSSQDFNHKNHIKSRFSITNRDFLIVLYTTLVFAILILIYTAISAPKGDQKTFVPAKIEDGRIIPQH